MKKTVLPLYILLVTGFLACMHSGGILMQAAVTPYYSTCSTGNYRVEPAGINNNRVLIIYRKEFVKNYKNCTVCSNAAGNALIKAPVSTGHPFLETVKGP